MSTPDPIESSSLGRWWRIPTGEKISKKEKGGAGFWAVARATSANIIIYKRFQLTYTSVCYNDVWLLLRGKEKGHSVCIHSYVNSSKDREWEKKLQNNWQKSNVFTWCWNSGWSLGRCHRPARNSWPSHNWRTSWRRPDSFQFRTRGQDTWNIKIKICNRLVTIRHRFIATNQSGGGQNGPTESVGSDLRVGRTLWRSKSRTTSSFGHGWSNVTWDWTRGDKSCTAVTKTTNNLWIGISKSGQSNRNANRKFMTIKKKYQIKIYKLERKMCV